MVSVRRRVLLVGRDPGVVGVLREYFHHSHDYDVESVEYCDDALTTLQGGAFDLVLVLSLRVPWRTWPSLTYPARRIGSESAILFLKQLRALHNPVPVLVVSSADVEAEALRCGAFAFVPKPVNLGELDHLVASATASVTRGGSTRRAVKGGPTMAECEVLIVAANRQVREVLHQIFLGEGYTCQVASDGDEGLAAFRSRRASIVLTELAMPGMSGMDFLRQIRSIDADVAVIVLADVFGVRARTECLESGADAYIAKSLNVGELLTAVERALEARDLIPPKPAPPPRQRSAGTGTDELSPEQFLDVFEHRSREPKSRLDPQFTVGIPIIRLWMDLRSRETVFQTDLDGLLDRFAAAAVAGVEGTPLFHLWGHVVRWGAELGLSVPERHPWAPPP